MDNQTIEQAAAHAHALDLLAICLIISIGGALGGLAQSVNRFAYWPPQDITQIRRVVEDDSHEHKVIVYFGIKDEKETPFGTIGKSATYWAVLTGTIVGIAGAFGLVGVFSLISVFHSEIDFLDNAYDFTKLFGVSVLGGYIARTALPQLGTAMTQRVLNAEKQIEEAASKISHSTDQIESTSVAVDKLNDSLAMEKAKNALFLNKLTIVDDNVWKQSRLTSPEGSAAPAAPTANPSNYSETHCPIACAPHGAPWSTFRITRSQPCRDRESRRSC